MGEVITNTPEASVASRLASSSRPEHMFPVLTSDQIARVAAHGRLRLTAAGEVLVDVGQISARFSSSRTAASKLSNRQILATPSLSSTNRVSSLAKSTCSRDDAGLHSAPRGVDCP